MIKENLWTWRCPNCGSSERVAQSIVDEDKAAGRLSENVEWGAVEMEQQPIMERGKKPVAGMETSVLSRWSDLCAKCGTMYYFRAERRIQKFSLDVSQLLEPSGGMPLPFVPPPGGMFRPPDIGRGG